MLVAVAAWLVAIVFWFVAVVAWLVGVVAAVNKVVAVDEVSADSVTAMLVVAAPVVNPLRLVNP